MKKLNFAPYYQPYLRSMEKTTTLRLGNSTRFNKGEEVMLTVGWGVGHEQELHRARITDVCRKTIGELDEGDLQGESPDCRSVESSKLVLSCVYRTVVSDDQTIYVIRFEHLPL